MEFKTRGGEKLMEELKACQTNEVGKLVESAAQTLDERCRVWQETLERAYTDGKYNQNTGLWEVDEDKVTRARYTLDAYRDALTLVDTLGSQIDNLRRAAPENKPLTLEQLRQMDGEPVWVMLKDGSGTRWGIIDINEYGVCANVDCDTAYWFDDVCGTIAYAHKPEQEAAP